MPRGAPPGKRYGGGRKVGQRNKATIERELIVAEIAKRRMSEAAKYGRPGRKLAIESLEEYGDIFEGAAAIFRPTSPDELAAGRAPNPNGDWGKFGEWMDRAFEARKEVSKTQTPRLTAVAIAPIPQVEEGERRKTFTLTVFEGGKALPPPDAPKSGNGAA